MTGIEFVDEPVEHADAPVTEGIPERPDPRNAGRSLLLRRWSDHRARTALAAALTLAAAGLALVAALSRLYTVGFGPRGQLFSHSIDAWGNYHGLGELNREGQHAARYGVVLVGCAVALLLLAVQLVAPRLRLRTPRRLTRATPYLRVGITGILAGITLAMYLDTAAVFGSARSSIQVGVSAGDPIRGDVVTAYGPCLWIALAAVGCAAAGVVAAADAARG
ncbi:hypothetical protein [uncultured Jatrophihabitans sp.]|uniref:hypothetical protein n=1 Tax=uncultured Jatrophihabitans sp. TaxID=1610747 RepID=UPI0035CA8095